MSEILFTNNNTPYLSLLWLSDRLRPTTAGLNPHTSLHSCLNKIETARDDAVMSRMTNRQVFFQHHFYTPLLKRLLWQGSLKCVAKTEDILHFDWLLCNTTKDSYISVHHSMSDDIPCCKRQHAGLVSGTVSVESISKHNSLKVDSIKHMLVILDHFVSVALFSCFYNFAETAGGKSYVVWCPTSLSHKWARWLGIDIRCLITLVSPNQLHQKSTFLVIGQTSHFTSGMNAKLHSVGITWSMETRRRAVTWIWRRTLM